MSTQDSPTLAAFRAAFEAASPQEQLAALTSMRTQARQAIGKTEVPLNPPLMRGLDAEIAKRGG